MAERAYDIYVGIDPDKDKSGVATYTRESKDIRVDTLSFPETLAYLSALQHKCRQNGTTMLVVIEASWMIENVSLHARWTDNKAIAAKKGYYVGINHEVGLLIREMCVWWNIPNVEQHPLRKCWNGKDRKITQEELAAILDYNKINGLKRTNQEGRDAALLALCQDRKVVLFKKTR